MNMKINTICFIILLFLLIGVASATDSDNETLQQTIKQPDNDICPDEPQDLTAGIGNDEKLQSCVHDHDRLEASTLNLTKLEASSENKKVLETLVTSGVKIKAPNVKMYYKDGSKFTVTLKNSFKKPIKKAKVVIVINGKSYTKTTNSNGKASISLNLNPGKYTVLTKFKGTKNYNSKSVLSIVTVKTTIKSGDLTKYYTNTASHSATFYDKKGKVLKNTAVKFKMNGKTYSVKTNKKGVAKLSVDLKPGSYTVSQTNPKTSQTTTDKITIKTILQTNDLTMTEKDASKFTVKILNAEGKAAANKKVTLKVNGKTYTPTSNSQGIASQTIDLPRGKYSVTTEYAGLVHTNQITVNKAVTRTPFSHITMIPDYVNVTAPYVFSGSSYAVKSGTDGIIKLPKYEVFAVHVSETKYQAFSTLPLPRSDTIMFDDKTYLVPFDGSDVKSDYDKNNLKGEGILISKTDGYTQIEFRSTTELDADLFGLTMDKHADDIEIITYVQNDLIKARILFFTGSFDELGLRINLGKLYNKNANEINDASYDTLTMNNTDKIRFTNTGQTVKYDESRKHIMPVVSKEDIKTKFIINGVEEVEKGESISYGLSDKYQIMRGFEVLQSYALLNDKVTQWTVNEWTKVSTNYLTRVGIMNLYAMFLAGLETAWLADEMADQHAKNLNVNWERQKTTTILGGINLDDTYLHVLNADMGMSVTGDEESSRIFKMMNSFYLPNIENHVLSPIANRYEDNTTDSLDNIIESVENNAFSIAQIGEMFYILCEDDNSTIVINSTSGISNVILIRDDFAYKGSMVPTACDCCSVGSVPIDILKGIKDTMSKIKNAGGDIAGNVLGKIHPLSILGYMTGNLAAGIAGKFITGSAALGLASTVGLIMGIHTVGNYVKNKFVDKKDWHWAYEHVTFTRDGYMQSKKLFNIPKSDGTYDYVEVKINEDGSLNRNDALYVGDGYTRKLSKSETYDYFTEEKWTSCNIPRKYQNYEVPLIFG